MTLHGLSGLRKLLIVTKRFFLTSLLGMDIDPSAEFSLSAKLDLTFPKGVHVGPHSFIAFGAHVLSHDRTRGLYCHTRIGANCFIGGNSIILPGVVIGDNCVIGAGSVVTRDVPARSVVAGNPAKIVQSDIDVGRFGRFANADEKERMLRAQDGAVAALPDRELGRD